MLDKIIDIINDYKGNSVSGREARKNRLINR